MLELLAAFAIGAATSTWFHRKTRRRRKVDVVPLRQSHHLSGLQRVALLLMTFPPELSARLFNELGPEEVQAITLEIGQLPAIDPELRRQVVADFTEALGIGEARLEEAAAAEPALIARALSRLGKLKVA